MKIRSGYLLREIAGTHVVVSVGNVDFDGMIKLNDAGLLLWNLLEKGADQERLIDAILAEYQVDRATAERDVIAFLDKLRNAELLDE